MRCNVGSIVSSSGVGACSIPPTAVDLLQVLYYISAHGFCMLLVPDILRTVLPSVFLFVLHALDLVLMRVASIGCILVHSGPSLAMAFIIREKAELSKTTNSTAG